MMNRESSRAWIAGAVGIALLLASSTMGVTVAVASTPAAAAKVTSSSAFVSEVPTATLSDSSVYPGTSVTVSGSGYNPGDFFQVFLDFVSPFDRSGWLGYGFADSDGTLSLSVTVPADTAPGSHSITVKPYSSPEPPTVPLTVIAYPPSAWLQPSSAPRGSGLLISGRGYSTGESVTATLGSIEVGSARVSREGTFSIEGTVPFTAPVAVQSVTVTGDVTAARTLPFTVTPATVTPAHTQTAEFAVGVSGTGYVAGETVTASFGPGAVILNQVTVEKDGRFHLNAPVPADAAPGLHIVTVTGTQTPPNQLEFWNVAITLSPDTAAPGDAYIVNGIGYPPGATVLGWFDNLAPVGSATVEHDGTFKIATTVPAVAPIGPTNYVFVMAYHISARHIQVPFTVVEATPALPTPESISTATTDSGTTPDAGSIAATGGHASRGLNIQTAVQRNPANPWPLAFTVSAGLIGAAFYAFNSLRNGRRHS